MTPAQLSWMYASQKKDAAKKKPAASTPAPKKRTLLDLLGLRAAGALKKKPHR